MCNCTSDSSATQGEVDTALAGRSITLEALGGFYIYLGVAAIMHFALKETTSLWKKYYQTVVGSIYGTTRCVSTRTI